MRHIKVSFGNFFFLREFVPTAVFVGLASLYFGIASPVSAGEKSEWKSLSGKHFIVFYMDELSFAETVARFAEKYYHETARQLGYTRYKGFWLWRNRVRIYIYRNHSEFIAQVTAPQWAAGKADYGSKSIFTYSGSEEFIRSLLKHELAHLVFRDFIGFQGEVPLWLDEGVAQWLEGRSDISHEFVKQMAKNDRLLSLADLTATDVRHEKAAGDVAEFYAQSVSVVEFMIRQYGAQKFESFCRQLRNGKNLNDALRFTYGGTIRSIEEIEKAWKKSLELR
ncbi:MAG: hypothetical protein JXN60_00920 [Lentisphaerae bacterium]|nr:hypothetical protein [Lentisphaerota bacterium]